MKPAFRTKAVLSLTVFSMFFGAGNLIFPPYLAAQSGENFPLALIGFYATAIGLPITALLAVERTDGLDNLAKRVHPLFGIIYTTAIYLAIGPCSTESRKTIPYIGKDHLPSSYCAYRGTHDRSHNDRIRRFQLCRIKWI